MLPAATPSGPETLRGPREDGYSSRHWPGSKRSPVGPSEAPHVELSDALGRTEKPDGRVPSTPGRPTASGPPANSPVDAAM
ncbi:hypothetical protein HPP92_006856 [Vanilla planifolia]|uniref:Uncharacterized protein n=1 Tax=Vanilla planifolia TaxID=51239 RepID=A0A835RPP2_VANPL|nr:hypothetical protein HPP92_007090 [Vanilla planifolia]KAG0489993.1 hypothetical protein HPP92_006856 [Vanilla planifolia]